MSGGPRAALRGADVRAALAGEQPIRRTITVCGWCPDLADQTAAARAHGYDVSHGLCAACAAKLEGQPRSGGAA